VKRRMHGWALVEIGVSSLAFRRAFARALNGLSLPRADSLEAAFGLACRVVLQVGDGVDPVAQTCSFTQGCRSRVIVACELAEGSEVARWARAGLINCFVGVASLVELRSAILSVVATAVVLDASDLAIEIAGVRTRLTRTQFQLFQHLSGKSGHWVTPSELVKQTLGTHHQNEAALVRVHIHAIRRALGPLAPVIETDPERARGYRFRGDLVQGSSATSSSGEPSMV
jgi:DNA-binding winged helix-turn-helix (wHTH) protein